VKASPSKLQVGVSPFGSSREVVLDLARRARDAGLDGLILGDGFVSTPSFPIWSGGIDCFVELAWLAGKVEMESYGIDAIVVPCRDPRVLAKQAASLAAVTEGRCHIALAAGFWAEDAQLFGFDFAERGARLDEGIRALLAAWRGESFSGKFWAWEAPLPISPCHQIALPEIWLSGAEATMRRAIRYKLPFEPTRMTPTEVETLARKYADAGGHELRVRTRMSVSTPVRGPGARDFPTLVGPPEYLAEQLAAYAALGVTYISVVAGYDDRSCAETIDALGVAMTALTASTPS
jgi:alkanesulfonate monooxygenase SsuD/methylene tetrahydromethanopterin reductase-like flavin-dependent oxidoreductase (luciferase family)